jgi:hypothetical protein
MSGKGWLQRARDRIVGAIVEPPKGLYVPAHMAGQHYGGFEGYERWIQDCICATTYVVRDAKKDFPEELAEMTALAMWVSETDAPVVFVGAHDEIVVALVRYVEQCADKFRITNGTLSEAAHTHITRAHGTREHGAILVIACKWSDKPQGDHLVKSLDISPSVWRVADLEEALDIPKRTYVLG